MKFSGVEQEGGTFLLHQPPVVANEATHVFQYWARIHFSEPFSGSVAVKWFQAWHKRDGGKGRVQWNTHNRLPCRVGARSTYWQVYDLSKETGCQGNQPVGPHFHDLDDDDWHEFTHQYKPHSAVVGPRDGLARMWIDGVKVIDVSRVAVGVTPPGGEKTWCELDDLDALEVDNGISTVWFGGVQTETTPPWTMDVTDLRWWKVEG